MAKARYTNKGNIKLTLTVEEAKEIRHMYGAMNIDACEALDIHTSLRVWRAVSDLLDGSPHRMPDNFDWAKHDRIANVLQYGYVEGNGHGE